MRGITINAMNEYEVTINSVVSKAYSQNEANANTTIMTTFKIKTVITSNFYSDKILYLIHPY